MHINLFAILQKNKLFFFAILGIACVLLIPVSTATKTLEENPDDSYALPLSKNFSLSIRLEDVPTSVTKISFWTGDTIKAPLNTTIEMQIEGEETVYSDLGNAITQERKITFPIHTRQAGVLNIRLAAPSLDDKKSLLLRTKQGDAQHVAYTVYKNTPLIIVLTQRLYSHNATADDIEYIWREGTAIANRENPYKKATISLHKDNKYATYFPLSYIASAIIQKAGFASFDSWLSLVIPLVLISQLLSAFAVLVFLYKQNKLALGVFSFFLILFHRFALYPARVYHIEFPAILFLLLGIMLVSKKIKTGYLLIGVSLAIKQVAIILLPIFLVWEFTQHKSIKKTLFSLALTLAIPFVAILPFIVSSPDGVLASISFSTNRSAGGDFATPDIGTLLDLSGSFSRMAMYGLIAVVTAAFWRKEIGMWGACLAILAVFMGFNPVLFFQYLAWIIPFIPLALSEAASSPTRLQVSRRFRDR